MITIAVCDDEAKVLEDIVRQIVRAFADNQETTEIFQTTDPFALLEYLKDNEIDALFLDIDMPRLDGMEIARALTDGGSRTLLVFVTSHDALVYQSFQYHPFGFIRKSRFEEEIAAVSASIADELQKKRAFFTFKSGDGFCRVPLSEILYFESESNYICLHRAGQPDTAYRFRGTLSSLEGELRAKGFIRTHKGFLVNQQHIFAIRGDDIQLDSGATLPIGRTNRENVKKMILRYMR